MRQSTKWYLLIFTLVILVCGFAVFWANRETGGRYASIYRDGVCVLVIDLDRVEETYTVPIGEGNTAEVSRDGIRMVCADCPDQICVSQGFVAAAHPVICLPNRVSIHLSAEDPESVDAAVG